MLHTLIETNKQFNIELTGYAGLPDYYLAFINRYFMYVDQYYELTFSMNRSFWYTDGHTLNSIYDFTYIKWSMYAVLTTRN